MLKRFVPILLFIGLVAWGVYQSISGSGLDRFARSDPDNEAVGIDVGNSAPDFTLQTLSGKSVSLSDFQGKHVIVNFWATWCPPCRAEMPDMQKYHEKFEDVNILAVNLVETEQKFENIGQFLDEYEITFDVLLDESTEVANIYKAHALPTSYLIDSQGIIRSKAIGAVNYDLLVKQFKSIN